MSPEERAALLVAGCTYAPLDAGIMACSACITSAIRAAIAECPIVVAAKEQRRAADAHLTLEDKPGTPREIELARGEWMNATDVLESYVRAHEQETGE